MTVRFGGEVNGTTRYRTRSEMNKLFEGFSFEGNLRGGENDPHPHPYRAHKKIFILVPRPSIESRTR